MKAIAALFILFVFIVMAPWNKTTKPLYSRKELIKEIKKGIKALKDKKASLYTLEELFDA